MVGGWTGQEPCLIPDECEPRFRLLLTVTTEASVLKKLLLRSSIMITDFYIFRGFVSHRKLCRRHPGCPRCMQLPAATNSRPGNPLQQG